MLIIFPFLPISVNRCYRTSNNRVYKSKELCDFQKKVDDIFENLEHVETLKGNLAADITFELKSCRKRDLDNMLKSLLDNLESRIFENDNQIFEIKCKKIHGCLADKTIVNIFEI
jgi:Holliday junction resolvase RusA-like endonuclease